MSDTVLDVERSLLAGVRRDTLRFPAGWEIRHLRARPPAPGVAGPLPAARSLPVPGGRVLVVVNDAQRATPTPWLMERLDCDWDAPGVRVAIASGCHAPPDESELVRIFGPFLERVRPRVHVHRAAVDPLVEVGVTRRGTPVQVNRIVDEAGAIVCLGSIEPHYFAGWTGGRKGLVPGLCSLETLRANHRLALDPSSRIGALEDNPLHLDLVEAAGMVGARLAERGLPAPLGVNALVAGDVVLACHAGPLLESLDPLLPRARRLFGRGVDRPAPLVVCFVDHPLDRDLYQALKALEHWKFAVAPGGVLVLVAACPAGVGPPTFTQFLEARTTAADLQLQAAECYRLGDHKLLNFLRYIESGRMAFIASPGLAGIEGLPVPIFPSPGEAIAAAIAAVPAAGRRALVVEDSAALMPVFGWS